MSIEIKKASGSGGGSLPTDPSFNSVTTPTLKAANGPAGNFPGVAISLSAGNSAIGATGGGLTTAGGAGNGSGGQININGGSSISTQNAGSAAMEGGFVASNNNSPALIVTYGAQTAAGGELDMEAGPGDTDCIGGLAFLSSGQGNGGNSLGSSITLTPGGATNDISGEILFLGHLVSQLDGIPAPTVIPLTQAGTGALATLSTNSSDAAGQINLTIGIGYTAGDQVTVTFASVYTNAPWVFITPMNDVTSERAVTNGIYVNNVSASSFTVTFDRGSASNGDVYIWNYLIMGNQA